MLPVLQERRWERACHSGMNLCRGLPVYFEVNGVFGILVSCETHLRE